MYSVAIIDDDESQRDLLAQMVEASPLANKFKVIAPTVASAASDSEGFGEHLGGILAPDGEQCANIALVDIELGEDVPSGIELVRNAQTVSGMQVIYVTGYVEYASDVYQTDHVGFLVKPVERAKLNEALARAVRKLDERASSPFLVRSGSSLVRLIPERITYIESNRRKVTIHETARSTEIYGKLSEFAERMPMGFSRCHKSFLVNLSYIEAIRSNDLVLTDGTTLPVSQRCRKELVRAFTLHVGREL